MTCPVKSKLLVLVLMAGLGLAACSDDPATPESMIEAARADLAQYLQVNPDWIDLVDARPVTWSNGAIGCARPGVVYSEAQVDGHLIVLTYEGGFAHYHQGGEDPPFLCLNPTE